jgi:hypothetical protein
MQVRAYKTTWGMGGTPDEILAKIKAANYEGWEDWIKPHFEIQSLANKHNLEYMAMVPGQSVEQFQRDINEAHDAGAVACTVHVGQANMEFQQGLDLLTPLVEIAKTVPFNVNFETHRGKLLNEPLSTARYLKAIPDLWLCADLSHWTVVTESMLGGFAESLELAISRTRHIHARVGHEEGPQVPDPRAKQWEGHVKAFNVIWDRIKIAHEKRGETVITFDPEYGPPNYMWTNPESGQPAADLWDVCLWQRDQLKTRWQNS